MLLVICFVVRRSLFVCCCLVCVGYCVLFDVCWLLLCGVYCLLFGVLCDVCCALLAVCYVVFGDCFVVCSLVVVA